MRGFSITDKISAPNLKIDSIKESIQTKNKPEKSFSDHLKETYQSVNQMHISADKMATNLSTGKKENIHETMLALSQAEISFKLMVQVRNKVLEAYQEIMRMQV